MRIRSVAAFGGGTAHFPQTHAQKLLARIVAEGSLQARASYGFWPACSEGSDIVLFTDESRGHELCRLPMLRQQSGAGPYRCLADFVAPVPTRNLAGRSSRIPVVELPWTCERTARFPFPFPVGC